MATTSEVEGRLSGVDAAVVLCGHTHLAREMRLADGRLVVNPGSVGLPAYDEAQPYLRRNEAGSPHARYAIVESNLAAGVPNFYLLLMTGKMKPCLPRAENASIGHVHFELAADEPYCRAMPIDAASDCRGLSSRGAEDLHKADLS
ncbi:metallophosphoesterase family protein [Rhizobium ruizarguesonis]|uniref:metallophosphoesterase family protein n=1 Tax=Rhizobium ruizarguesonis TaxID=2081791 RepID=UPI0018D57DB2